MSTDEARKKTTCRTEVSGKKTRATLENRFHRGKARQVWLPVLVSVGGYLLSVALVLLPDTSVLHVVLFLASSVDTPYKHALCSLQLSGAGEIAGAQFERASESSFLPDE